MHTEFDAHCLLCPLNRDDGFCSASECAMWRWADVSGANRATVRSNHRSVAEPKEDRRHRNIPEGWEWDFDPEGGFSGWVEPLEDALERRTGYCGLAGRPGFAP